MSRYTSFRLNLGEAGAGVHIAVAAEQAVHIAKTLHMYVSFAFNDVELGARPDSYPDAIVSEYKDAIERRRQYAEKSDTKEPKP